MKNNSLIILLISGFCLLFASCTKEDSCKDVSCPVGFTATSQNGGCECVSDNTEVALISKAGMITANETWTSDNMYKLIGKVVVGDGVSLTIEAGTIIKGAEGTGSLASALIVARGGKIFANGTAQEPIIFTSILDNIEIGQAAGTNLDETQNAMWGGVIVLGKAPGSFEGDVQEFQIEGIPADDAFGLYGGTDPADNSGSINYISIRHGGALIGEGNEINGLTLGCVGSGTVINQVEIVGNLDDGIEFFGGTVNVTNAIVWAQGDDAFDIDQAYSGTIDNFVYVAGPDSDHGLEVDGPEGSATGRFTAKNGTLKGLSAEMADFRDGAMGTVQDCYFFNFTDSGDLELDDDVTSANYFADILTLTGLQFNTNQALAAICHDKAPNGDDIAFDTKFAISNTVTATPTKGANTSVFAWTYTSQKNALNF